MRCCGTVTHWLVVRNGVSYSEGPNLYGCLFWLLDFRLAGLQGFASALILRVETVWRCGRGSDPGLQLLCLLLRPMRCLNAPDFGNTGVMVCLEISEPVLFDLQFEDEPFL